MRTLAIALSLFSIHAVAAPRPYDATHYAYDIKLSSDGSFQISAAIDVQLTKSTALLEFDAYNLEIQSATVNGSPAKFTPKAQPDKQKGTVELTSSANLPSGKSAHIVLDYSGKAGLAHRGLFIVKKGDDHEALPYFFTQFEPNGAHSFLICNDDPSDKATVAFTVTTDSRQTILATGLKKSDDVLQQEGKNVRKAVFELSKPSPTYAWALAVGVFKKVEVSTHFPAALYVRPGTEGMAFAADDATRHAISAAEALTQTPFPWPELHTVAVPHFFWSGMENTGLIFNRESKFVLPARNDFYTRAHVLGLFSHEIAHQWFGDSVTLKHFGDTWLNEGFATYIGEQIEDAYYDNDLIEVHAMHGLINDYMRADDGPKARALVSNAVTSEDSFDDIAYQKGAAVLRMLDHWVGRAEFKKILKLYVETYGYKNATSSDFVNVAYKSTKNEKELKPFFQSWLYKKGYPIATVEWSYNASKVTLRVKQKPSHASEKGAFTFKLPVVIHRQNEPGYSQAQNLIVTKEDQSFTFDVPSAPEWVNWNKSGSTLVKITSSSISEFQLTEALRHDSDPAWRSQAAIILLDVLSTASNETSPDTVMTEAALGAVSEALENDANPYVREVILKELAKAKIKVLPTRFSKVVLALAKSPKNLTEDPLGRVFVRRAAMAALGRFKNDDGRNFLLEELSKGNELDINYSGAIAKGVAKIGTLNALSSLRAAGRDQLARGEAFAKPVIEAISAVENPDALADFKELCVEQANNPELFRALLAGADRNQTFAGLDEYPTVLRALILDEKTFGADLRGELMDLFAQLKTPKVAAELSTILTQSSSDRIRSQAKLMLEGLKIKPAGKVVAKQKM